jgi:hypothetical protein
MSTKPTAHMRASHTVKYRDFDAPPEHYLGWVRRFGPAGVPYEVIRVLSRDEVCIRVITTGEETTYAVSDLLSDPED